MRSSCSRRDSDRRGSSMRCRSSIFPTRCRHHLARHADAARKPKLQCRTTKTAARYEPKLIGDPFGARLGATFSRFIEYDSRPSEASVVCPQPSSTIQRGFYAKPIVFDSGAIRGSVGHRPHLECRCGASSGLRSAAPRATGTSSSPTSKGSCLFSRHDIQCQDLGRTDLHIHSG